MPVVGHTDPSGKFVVGRFFERIMPDQLIAEGARLFKRIPPSSEFAILLIIELSVDLSAIDSKAIVAIREARKRQFAERDLRRRTGAAVIDPASDTHLIMRLWNAMNEIDPTVNLNFHAFDKVGPALEWIEVPAKEALPVIDETMKLAEPLRLNT